MHIVNARLKEDELNEMLLKLYDIFEKNGDAFNKSFCRYLTCNPIDFGSELNKSEDKLKKWIKDNGINIDTDSKSQITPEKLFKTLRQLYNIDKKYKDEEAYKIMVRDMK